MTDLLGLFKHEDERTMLLYRPGNHLPDFSKYQLSV